MILTKFLYMVHTRDFIMLDRTGNPRLLALAISAVISQTTLASTGEALELDALAVYGDHLPQHRHQNGAGT